MQCTLGDVCKEVLLLRLELEELITRFEDFTFDFDDSQDMVNIYDIVEDLPDINFAM